MKNYFKPITYVGCLFAVFLQVTMANAEFNCQTDVSYKWKPEPSEKNNKDQKPQKNPEPEKEMPDQEVFYSSVSVTGSDEAAAKSLLAPRTQDSKAAAMRKCQDEHQNVGRCFSTKLTGAATILNTASFTARKLLEESMMNDCKSVSGKCGEVLSSEPKCVEKVVAAEASPVAEDPKGAKKDDKKKK